jgi:hypothetical protein
VGGIAAASDGTVITILNQDNMRAHVVRVDPSGLLSPLACQLPLPPADGPLALGVAIAPSGRIYVSGTSRTATGAPILLELAPDGTQQVLFPDGPPAFGPAAFGPHGEMYFVTGASPLNTAQVMVLGADGALRPFAGNPAAPQVPWPLLGEVPGDQRAARA